MSQSHSDRNDHGTPARRCPICQGPVQPRAENAAFPFCQERCRLADLGRWLGEEYRIPGDPAGDGAVSSDTTGSPRPAPDDADGERRH